MKTIITVYDAGNRGKSSTLIALGNLLLTTYDKVMTVNKLDPKEQPITEDFTLVVQIGRKKIGIESMGDPGTELRDRLQELVNSQCDIIFCSARTRGETVDDVNVIADENGYQGIWTSPYLFLEGTEEQCLFLNQLSAKHLLDLLQTLIMIDK
jgi:hypothetical protein